MNLGRFTEPRLLVPRLLSDRPQDAIGELAKRFEAVGRIGDTAAFVDAVLKRERELSTFVERVAVPHVRGGAVRKLSIAVGMCPNGMTWTGDKRRVVHAVFLFAVPLTEARRYLSLLSGLSGLIQDDEAFGRLLAATQPEEMWQLLKTVRDTRRHSPVDAESHT